MGIALSALTGCGGDAVPAEPAADCLTPGESIRGATPGGQSLLFLAQRQQNRDSPQLSPLQQIPLAGGPRASYSAVS